MDALDRFSPATRDWFGAAFATPTAAQIGGWEAIAAGTHTLIHAPTGSGKTLAAFLSAIDGLMAEPEPPEAERCRVLYISPMKALAYDVDRNLRAPLAGISISAQRLGLTPPRIDTAMRTGDTPADERRRMQRHPPDILITTPESLYLILTSQARAILRSVRTVILDEVHSVAATKRGSHLSLSLERLEQITNVPPQRIGLSATQRPLERIAEFMGGGVVDDSGAWTPRDVVIVDAPREKTLDIGVIVPVEDMTRPGETTPAETDPERIAAGGGPDPKRRSIWPSVYPRILGLIKDHHSTIVFVNSRGLSERLAAELNALAGEEMARAHHGSVSREQRLDIEDRLKRGDLKAVVATSTLELGIDMAAVDLVVLVESPNAVSTGMQRVGRAGHQVGAPSVAKVFPKHRGDLLEATVTVQRMVDGAIEETMVPKNPLDVLAQHIVAMAAVDAWQVDELFNLVRGAGPYRDLTRLTFESVLDMLAGRYPSDEFAELRPRIIWDRVQGSIEPRGNARLLAVTNPGTIPDRGMYRVVLPEGGRVGELDEEMVYESRPGDLFTLGSSTWRIGEITHDRVIVTPAPGEPAAKMPFWHGEGPGRPLELGRAVGAFVREIGGMDTPTAVTALRESYRLDQWAAENLAAFVADEKDATGSLPTDKTLVVERFRDEIGDWRLLVLSPLGARVHAPWALAARSRYRQMQGSEVDVIWSDDGIAFRFPDVDEPPSIEPLLIDPEDIEEIVISEVGDSALFTSKFREAAARALLLPRRRPDGRTPLWLQRRRAADLLGIAKRFGSFPIILETYREVLQDHFDLPALTEVLGDIRARRIRVAETTVSRPSPFASSLMFDFIANFMYDYDAPVAEKRAAALTLDRNLLRELLGDPEFRDLLDPEVIQEVELELQRLAIDRKARSADQMHDLLRDLGPLTTEGVAARCEDTDSVKRILESLEATRRIARIRMAHEERWTAVEDIARLRDALGVTAPPGIADALLEPVPDPLGDVVGRYARTHGPFSATDVATSLGLPVAAVGEVLGRLENSGRVFSGMFRAGDPEWVDTNVLARIRRRSLARLRSEVEAVDPETLGRFLPQWHRVGSHVGHADRLNEVVRQLQGSAIPASILETDVLPLRMSYQPSMLDALAASGDIVWLGRGALGAKDGRVGLYLRDHVSNLAWSLDQDRPEGSLHDAIRTHLSDRGASFFRELYEAAGGGDPQLVVDAVWDLVWAGEITNDTLAPLRAFLWGKARRKSARPSLSATTPPSATGRWSLASDLVIATAGPEAQATARAEQLLERYGLVTRDAVLAESVPGGFAGLYPVLAAMEDAGRVRRGYFIEGMGGAQFALPGAVDRLRALEPSGVVWMAAADPANPYGASVPWPDGEGARPSRRAGAYVVLNNGRLVIYVEKGGRRILTFEPDADTAAGALADLALARTKRSIIETVDGEPVTQTPLGAALLSNGFVASYKGVVFKGGHRARA